MAIRSEYDLLVVGAGIHGLIMAKTYLDVYPNVKLAVLESAGSVGGTWSAERLYPGLKSNNLVGSYEFSDFPMDSKFGVGPGQHIPGTSLHAYLQAFSDKFDITRRTYLNSPVETIEKLDSSLWSVKCAEGSQVRGPLTTKKLVIATGLTSEPFIPYFKGQETFGAPLIHAKQFLDRSKELMSTKKVIVLGGSKSAYDAGYALASQGIQVEWIIRESGHGTNWMAPPYVTPFKKRIEGLVGVRFLTWMSPCIWGAQDGFAGIRRFLHNTRVGRFLVDGFWNILKGDIEGLTGYNSHPEIAKLKPKVSPFWHAAGISILNYPTDFFEFVRNGTIKIHIADISHLSLNTVHLSNGEEVTGEGMICSTGWRHRPSIKFLPEGLDGLIGIPSNAANIDPKLIQKADDEILTRLPRLANQPTGYEKYKPLQAAVVQDGTDQPFRLYRFMVPPKYINDPSLGFIGIILSVHTTTCAQAQALWLTAYLTGRLPQQKTGYDTGEVMWETILQSQFGKWRYPAGFGARYPDSAFDTVPYMDMLLREMGLTFRRKNGWWNELFSPYGPKDYVGLVDEWRVKEAKAT